MSALGWKDDPQFHAISLRHRGFVIGGDDSGYSRFSPKTDVRQKGGTVEMNLKNRYSGDILVVAERDCSANNREVAE